MSFKILADENVDHRVVFRLSHFGHDIQHVDFVPELGKGSTDVAIVEYSKESNRLIMSGDIDFITEFDSADYYGLLFIEDETLSVKEISDIVDEISAVVDADQIESVIYVSNSWL